MTNLQQWHNRYAIYGVACQGLTQITINGTLVFVLFANSVKKYNQPDYPMFLNIN